MERQLKGLARWKGGPLGKEISPSVTHALEIVIRNNPRRVELVMSDVCGRGHREVCG